MLVYPAIDLLDGKIVRLREGRRDAATFYAVAPKDLAATYARAGARRIHVVDLDAAFGTGGNYDAIAQIRAAGSPVQLGGGVRDLATVTALLEAGVERVVLGTAAVKDPELVEEACRLFPERIVVAVDARDGKVAIDGWATVTSHDAVDVAAEMVDAGAVAILYTDIRRDGTGRGPNVDATARLAEALYPVEVIASGGIATLDDIARLAAAKVPACVVGRALLDGNFTLADALRVGAGLA